MSSGHASPRILIVRLSAIGDVMHGLPVLCALRDALPTAFIAWLVDARTAELLRSHKALDQVIAVPRRWLKSPRAVLTLRRQLRACAFDVAIDLQGLAKSAVAARLCGAPKRVGFDGQDGREFSRWLNNELVLPASTHVIDRNLELLRPLGIDRPAVRFDLDLPAEAVAAAREMLELVGLGDEPFAVINPGAGWPSKRWPPERFAALARYLRRSRDVRSLVVWAGKQERDMTEQIVAESEGSALVAPATSLLELAAIAKRACLFVGSDTGPLHLAVAVGAPCVGLFGPMPAERNGPYGPQHIALQRMCLTGASRRRRAAGPESMEAISTADACAACDRILDRATVLARSDAAGSRCHSVGRQSRRPATIFAGRDPR